MMGIPSNGSRALRRKSTLDARDALCQNSCRIQASRLPPRKRATRKTVLVGACLGVLHGPGRVGA